MTVPDRYRAKINRLTELAEAAEVAKKELELEDGDALAILFDFTAQLALEVGSFVAEMTHVEEALAPDLDGLVPVADAAIESRFVVHELALAELYSRVPAPAAPEPDDEEKRVFGFPVVLLGRTTAEDVRRAVDAMEPGLSELEVLARLEELELVQRTGKVPS